MNMAHVVIADFISIAKTIVHIMVHAETQVIRAHTTNHSLVKKQTGQTRGFGLFVFIDAIVYDPNERVV